VGAALLALLFFARRRQTFRGQVFFLFTFTYGVARFVLERFRDDAERGDVPPSLPPHWLYALAFAGFAVAFSVGLARMIRNVTLRGLTRAAAFVPAVVLFVTLQPAAFETVPKIQLSTSQAVGLFTAIASMLAFAMFHRAAIANPRGAMALPDFSRFEEEDDVTSEEEPSPKAARTSEDQDGGDSEGEADAEPAEGPKDGAAGRKDTEEALPDEPSEPAAPPVERGPAKRPKKRRTEGRR
jgi:phosphatidylglycerol:prolipoprotein diacylglycerol transferase